MTSHQIEKLFKILSVGLLAFVALIVCTAIGWPYLRGVVQSKEEQQQQAIVADVRPLIETCQATPGSAAVIPIRGKALIWDMRANARSDGHSQLPEELRAAAADEQITVIMIVGEHAVPLRDGNGQPCGRLFRQQVDVCIAYWPQKQVVGAYSVAGKTMQFG